MEIPVTVLILALVLFIIIFFVMRRKRLNYPAGSCGWPFLGETLEFLKANKEGKPEKFVKERIEKYKSKIFKTSLMGETVVVVIWWQVTVKKLLGPCLANSVGEEAKIMKKILSSFVSPDAFSRLYIKAMQLVVHHHFMNYWQGNTLHYFRLNTDLLSNSQVLGWRLVVEVEVESQVSSRVWGHVSDLWQGKKSGPGSELGSSLRLEFKLARKDKVKVFPLVKLYGFKVACQLFMSIEDHNDVERLSVQFNIFLKRLYAIPLNLPGTTFYKAIRATNVIRKELLQFVRKRREALEQKTASPHKTFCLICCPVLMKMGSTCLNYLLLITYCSCSLLAMTLHLSLLLYSSRLLQSTLKFIKTFCKKMKYSWSVISEVMRITPPILGAYREAIVDINYEGYHIPKGWNFLNSFMLEQLYWNTGLTSLDPEIFPNPTRLEPSRFEEAGPAPYTYVTFGGGPRMCLGKEFARLEMLVFLHVLIKKFTWKLLIPNEKFIYDPMPTPLQGLPISLQPHN
ncbi:hypothetical protein H5410_002951 [Solanum commersonii]|uniref:Cytochrome P450 n=1 Tax=Solanum commersonii TaxID=4109 RepID=A0A9J6B3R9_SOLCO|nr:hypothetical protein H5410_002951 [Solanum commersonii]